MKVKELKAMLVTAKDDDVVTIRVGDSWIRITGVSMYSGKDHTVYAIEG